MTPEVIRRLTLVHGIVAWVDAVLFFVVAILLLRKNGSEKSWFRSVAVTATLGAVVAFASGMALELHYRVHLRQRLFIASKSLGWLFERKIHLSLGGLVFATIGLITLLLTRKDARFFASMRIAYLLAAICALTASVLSSIVRIAKPFVE